MTPPQTNRRDLGYLTFWVSEQAAQLWPHKPGFLWREVGGRAEGGKGPADPMEAGKGSVVPMPGPGTPRGHWEVAWE